MTNPTALPLPDVSQDDLNLWFTLTAELARVKAAEMELRKKIFANKFPKPVEGTNTVPLSDGWVLKGQYKIDRKVDEAMLLTLQPEFKEHKLPIKDLITYSPELAIRAYRDLTEEQRKLFNQVLVIKPGSPAMEIVKPKR